MEEVRSIAFEHIFREIFEIWFVRAARGGPRLSDLGLLDCRGASRGTDLHRPSAAKLRTPRSRGPHQVARLLLDSGLGVKPAWKRSAQTTYSIISAVIPSHKKQSPRPFTNQQPCQTALCHRCPYSSFAMLLFSRNAHRRRPTCQADL